MTQTAAHKNQRIGAENDAGAVTAPAAKRRRFRGWAAGAALLLLLAGLFAVYRWAQREQAPRYMTAPVTRGSIVRAISASGTVNPYLTIIVGVYVSGVVQNLYCDFNTMVRKGQLCALIDQRPYKAALEQAQGQLARDRAQLEGARVDLERYRTLVGQNSLAKQTFEDQQATVHQLEGTVKFDQGLVDSAQTNLDYTQIISPVDGVVVSRNVTIGQTEAATLQTPTLFLIATDLADMEVDTNVTESDIGAVAADQRASFTVESFSNHPFEGKVIQIRQAPQTVQNVVTYDVIVGCHNEDMLLKPGMTATVLIETARRDNVLRVPDRALRFAPGGETARAGGSQQRQVWVLRDGRPKAVDVKLGLDDDANSELISGDLKKGDEVIIGEQRASQAAAPHFGL